MKLGWKAFLWSVPIITTFIIVSNCAVSYFELTYDTQLKESLKSKLLFLNTRVHNTEKLNIFGGYIVKIVAIIPSLK